MDEKMVEATRLTRLGRLAEATALIQQCLGGTQAHPVVPSNPVAAPPTIDVTFRVGEPTKAIGEPAAAKGRRTRAGRGFATPDLMTPGAVLRPGKPRSQPGGGPVRQRLPEHAAAPAAGRWLAGTHTSAAGTLAYKLYVPSGYRGQAMPLVVMLHGCTQDPDDFAAGTRMSFLAEAEGFVVLYPAQTAAANPSRCWNWFQAAHQARDQGEPALIAGTTRQVMAEYHNDAGRIYVAGLSAGGAMAAIMAATYPDLYAAVGVHSGLAPGSAHDLASGFQAMRNGGQVGRSAMGRGIPLILFHGDDDSTVHPCNAEQLVQQWVAAGPLGTAATTPTLRQGRTPGGRTYTCAIYHEGHGRSHSVVEHWTLHGAGHAWSGGAPHGSYTDPDGPDASRELVRFFRAHARGTAARAAGG
jgi:poly(hydroxyalkanoate) depolymerase family esterase